MNPTQTAIFLGLLAGAPIFVGALLAKIEALAPRWHEAELRHGVMAFGGGALLAAVALVLVPEGSKGLSIGWVAGLFLAGSLGFLLIDRLLAKSSNPASQLVAMLADFLPEAVALGAFLAMGENGMLLAFLIALQNLPEGFNAYREVSGKMSGKKALIVFAGFALLGPVATLTGLHFLAQYLPVVHGMMIFASGGILYLIFQDIAPQAKLERHWLPPLGAVAGFLLGLIGHLMSGG